MNTNEKNVYAKPTIEDLGSLASMTQGGELVNADGGGQPNNTASKPIGSS